MKQKALAKAAAVEERLAAARKKAIANGTNEVGMVGRLGRALGKFNLGNYFGKGSRNDFVNIVGSMIGGLGKLVTVPLSLIAKGLDSFFTTFAAGWKSAADGANVFTKAMSGIGGVFAAIGESLPAWPVLVVGVLGAVAALGALAAMLPGIISLVGLLATALVSLTSAISFGLIGALLAVAPAAAGALLGLSGVFLAIRQFASDKKNKQQMKEWFEDSPKNWAKQFKGFAKSFLGDMHEVMHTLMDTATPAVKAFFKSWDENLKDASTKKSGQAIVDSLSRIATTFTSTLPNLLSGLIGFFKPIMPYAEKLATAIGNAFKTFDEWANSKPGRNAIADFMKRAWEDANDVWNILTDIGSIIATVFDFGESEGDSFLKGIHGWLQKIDTYLNNPENKGAIDAWFANAKQIGDDVGKIATGIGDAIKGLSSPEGQANAKVFMDNIAALAQNLREITDMIVVIGKISSPGLMLLGKVLGFDTSSFTPKEPPKPKVPPKPVGPLAGGAMTGAKGSNLPGSTYTTQFDIQTTLNGKGFTGGVGEIFLRLGLNPSQVTELAGYVVPVDLDDKTYQSTKAIIEAFKFTGKQVPVDGNEKEWNAVKGTVAGYAFDPKTVKISADASDVAGAVASAKRYLSSLPATKRIRIAGVNGVGGIPLAAGGVFDKATAATIGEAGPEAVVPLNRPLSQVDPAVRALSAIAQGMTGPKGLPAATTAGPRVMFSEGAIQVNLPTGDPKLAAEAVLDRLVSYIG